MMKLTKIVLSVILGSACFTAKPVGLQDLKAMGLGVLLYESAIVIHELGHALAAKLLYKNPQIHITLGHKTDNPLYTSNNLTIEKLPFFGGGTDTNNIADEDTKTKSTIQSLAGPLTEIAFGASALALSHHPLLTVVNHLVIANGIMNFMPLKKSGWDGENIAHTITEVLDLEKHKFCISRSTFRKIFFGGLLSYLALRTFIKK